MPIHHVVPPASFTPPRLSSSPFCSGGRTGVATTLIGEALLTGSRSIGLWALAFITVNHLYFLVIEEPGLEQRFGKSYEEYKRAVPRWVPRLRKEAVGRRP